MIEEFKIVSGKYDREVSDEILKFNANTPEGTKANCLSKDADIC